MIVDTFMFFNELDTLEIRLRELAPVVDLFVLLECGETLSGVKKPYIFEQNKERFAPFLNKIRHVKLPGLPPLVNDTEDNRFWLEKFQRNFLMAGLVGTELRGEDLILISDVDEIPSRTSVLNLNNAAKEDEIWVFKQTYYKEFLDLEVPKDIAGGRWLGTVGVRYSLFGNILPQELRWSGAGAGRFYDPAHHDRADRHFIEKGGWHLTYFGGEEASRYKIANYAHGARAAPGAAAVTPVALISREHLRGLVGFNEELELQILEVIRERLGGDVPSPIIEAPESYYHFFKMAFSKPGEQRESTKNLAGTPHPVAVEEIELGQKMAEDEQLQQSRDRPSPLPAPETDVALADESSMCLDHGGTRGFGVRDTPVIAQKTASVERKPLFGLLVYSDTDNLGDEIQSIATKRFLPNVDYQFDRDAIDFAGPPPNNDVRLILNGWFMYRRSGTVWPPPEQIKPLITSFHLTPDATDFVLSEDGLKFLRRYGPVGCRDLYTLGVMRRHKVESFFSACLTLTLERPDIARDDNLIVVNDVSAEVKAKIAAQTGKKIVSTTHSWNEMVPVEARFERAEELLRLYAQASCVVTTRLHCTFPCMAMNTPVLLINKSPDVRFPGLNTFVFNCHEEELISDHYYYDFDDPIPNPETYIRYRHALIEAATDFVQQNVIKPEGCP